MASIRRRCWTTAQGEQREAWQTDFIAQDGRRHQLQFARRKDADAWLTAARAQVQQGVFTPGSASVPLSTAIALWLERAQAEGLEHGTLQHYGHLVAHIRALMPENPKLARITQPRVEQFRDDALRAHSRLLARKILSAFKSVLKDAKRRGLVTVNVAADTVIGVDRRRRRRLEVGVDVPLPKEVQALLDAARPRTRALVALAALAGLRASEIRALRWSDLRLGPCPTVTVAQRADRWGDIGAPKSPSSQRAVPLGVTATQALREWRLAQPPGHTLVFGMRVDRPMTHTNLYHRLLMPLCVAAGVRRYGWHSLRHYAVSAWLASNIDPKTVQQWAGHATLSLTLDRYGHFIPRTDDHARIAAAEQVLRG
jgi:integrase